MEPDNPRPTSLPLDPHFIAGPGAARLSPITPHPRLSQICITSEQMANQMNMYLEKVLFFKVNPATCQVNDEMQ